MAARVVDWGLALLIATLVATGLLTLFAGAPGDAWVFAVHDAVGIAIVALVALKLRRVWPRLARFARWEWRTVIGALALVAVAGALGSGFLWADGVTPAPAGYSLLSWHEALGVLLAVAVLTHMVARARPLRGRDVAHRREFVVAGGMALGALVAWRAQRPLQALFDLRGARRRFTGSYEVASFAGNAFPSTSWVADHPHPVDPASYRLRVGGLTARDLQLSLADLQAGDELVATLDCTGGFYSTQRWHGVRLGRLLDLAQAAPAARHVTVASRTGYRWSFALDHARRLLLATHVGGDRLSHEHGAPVRLVVPGARGFEWVKWVQRIELREDPDYGAPASTVWSSLTAAGRGA